MFSWGSEARAARRRTGDGTDWLRPGPSTEVHVVIRNTLGLTKAREGGCEQVARAGDGGVSASVLYA